MLTMFLTLASTLLAASSCSNCSSLDNFFSKADLFLRAHVSNGLVDYNAIKANPASLNEIVNIMATADLAGKDVSIVKAFWINAYNLTMIRSVGDYMPINSPLDVPGMFDAKQHKLAGQMLTLNDIENKKLRDVYHDARIHFVLVCGAKGCPSLFNGAYMPTQLETQLLTQTRNAINNATFIRVDAASQTVKLSEIFKWYSSDFTTGGKTLLQFINQYRNTTIPTNYTVDYYPYDWTLNIKK